MWRPESSPVSIFLLLLLSKYDVALVSAGAASPGLNASLPPNVSTRWSPFLPPPRSASTWNFRKWPSKFGDSNDPWRSEEHTAELQQRLHLVCRLLLVQE